MPAYPLTNFEIQKYHEKEPTFDGVYSRNNWPKIKDGTFVIHLDEYESIATHWIALYVNDNSIIYSDTSGVYHIPKEFTKFIGNKNILTSIYRIQAYDSIISGYFSIVFIDFMLKGKSWLDYTYSFSP